MLTHQQIPLLLVKSALRCWMHPTAQIALSPTPSHPWVPQEWPYCQQAQCGGWFTVKHSKAGLQTSSHPQNSFSLLGHESYIANPKKLNLWAPVSYFHSKENACLPFAWITGPATAPGSSRFYIKRHIASKPWNSLIAPYTFCSSTQSPVLSGSPILQLV